MSDRARKVFEYVKNASACVLMIGDKGDLSPRQSMQVGVAVLFDKPIMAVVAPGTKVPEKLARVVDRFVELSPGSDEQIAEAIFVATKEFLVEIGLVKND